MFTSQLNRRDDFTKILFIAIKKYTWLCVAAILAVARPSWAGLHPRGPNDYLRPEISFTEDPDFSEYEFAVSRLFFQGLSRYRRVQMMVLPPFKPELAVFVESVPPERECSSGVEVVVVQARENIGQAGMRRLAHPQNQNGSCTASPWDGLAIATDVVHVTIDCGTAQLLQDLWQEILYTVRYPRAPAPGGEITAVVDATSYHFATFQYGVGWRSGVTESPEPSTAPGRLLAIGLSLVAYVKAPEVERKGRLVGLVSQARALLNDIR